MRWAPTRSEPRARTHRDPMITDPLTRLAEELAALDRAYSRGHHGRWSAGRRSDLLDAAIVALFEAADPPPGTALAALGGYGRRQQLPRSDVDLLVVHDGDRPDDVAVLVDRLLYPLWDAGLEVGQAVRTPEECAAIVAGAARRRHRDAGRSAPGGRRGPRRRGVRPRPRRGGGDPDGFVTRLREGAAARADRYGSTAHLLEPELKEGAGGSATSRRCAGSRLVSGGGRPAPRPRASGPGGRRGVPDPGPQRAAPRGGPSHRPARCSTISPRSPARWGSRTSRG